MSTTFAGNYPIEHRKGEIERLHAQAAALAPDTRIMLERIGIKPGWSCLDIGCGPRGITDLLSERVGSGGRVVGLVHGGARCHIATPADTLVSLVAGVYERDWLHEGPEAASQAGKTASVSTVPCFVDQPGR